MILNKYSKIEITPTTPFNFDATFFKPDHFTIDDHEYIPGIRWQTINWDEKQLGLKISNKGKPNDPKVILEIYSQDDLSIKFLDSLKKEIEYRFNLGLDLNDFYTLFKNDPHLVKPFKNLKGMRPGHPSSLYEYLIIGIILQNASVRRSAQMFRNLLETYGTQIEFDNKKLLCLWIPGRFKNVDEQELRDLKIGYRAKSIKRLDKEFFERSIKEEDIRKLDLQEQRKFLISLYGVGPATVWYILFDVFHQWDFFDHISPWEQKLYSQLFFNRGLDDLASVDELFVFINQYDKYKQLAVHYMWEDLWWRRYKGEIIPWLEKEIRS